MAVSSHSEIEMEVPTTKKAEHKGKGRPCVYWHGKRVLSVLGKYQKKTQLDAPVREVLAKPQTEHVAAPAAE